METKARKPYPTDVTDEGWAFAAPYLAPMTPAAPHRRRDLREVFAALRWLVRTGAKWRYPPDDLPPWPAVYQQTRRWSAAGVFEAMGHDPRAPRLWAQDRPDAATAAVRDGRTVRSSPESGARSAYDGHERAKGSKIHLAVDTLGHLLARRVTPADAHDRAQVAEPAAATGDVAFVDQGYTGEAAAAEAAGHGIRLEGVKLPAAKRGFVLLPRRWVVERSFARAARFRRRARDYERLPDSVAGLHVVAFAYLMLHRLLTLAAERP